MTTAGDEEALVTIREYTVPLEAEWAQNVLASAGICCLIPDRNVNYLYTPVTPVRVQVPAAMAEEARAVLTEMELHRQPVGGPHTSLDRETPEVPPGAPEEEPEAVEAIDPHDLCPMPERPALACPACGSGQVDGARPPTGAEPSVFETLLSAVRGRGWLRCAACGHLWEG